MVSYSRLRLHQNICIYSCAPTSKCLLLLQCAYIKIVSFSRVPASTFFACNCVTYTCVRLYLNSCLYLCPVLSSFYLNVLLCAFFDFVFLHELQALTAIASVETTRVRPMKFNTIILCLKSTLSDRFKSQLESQTSSRFYAKTFASNLIGDFLPSNLALFGQQGLSFHRFLNSQTAIDRSRL